MELEALNSTTVSSSTVLSGPASAVGPDNDRRYRQQWLPLGAATFAVGAVDTSRGERVLRRDTDSDVFLVSDKNESDLTDDIGRSAFRKIGVGLLMTVSMLAILGFYLVGWLFL